MQDKNEYLQDLETLDEGNVEVCNGCIIICPFVIMYPFLILIHPFIRSKISTVRITSSSLLLRCGQIFLDHTSILSPSSQYLDFIIMSNH